MHVRTSHRGATTDAGLADLCGPTPADRLKPTGFFEHHCLPMPDRSGPDETVTQN